MTLRIRDLDRWYKVENGLLFQGEALRTVAVEVSTVGPTMVLVVPYTLDKAGRPTYDRDEAVFGGVVEGRETIEVTWGGNFALAFDMEAEVWALRDQTPVAIPSDPDLPKFTRFEKQGLFVDDLSVALHRQAVLTRLAEKSKIEAQNVREAGLQQQLAELAAQVKALTPPPPPEKEPPSHESEDK